MKFERGRAYSFWIVQDSDGYICDYVCTEGTAKPEGAHVVNVATLINERWEQVGDEFKTSGALGGLPLGPR